MRSIAFVTLLSVVCIHGATPVDVPPPPRFSIENMDRSVDPKVDFFKFSSGTWQKNNPVPADKSRWSGFDELQERNWRQIRSILENSASADGARGGVGRLVGDFYASATDTNRIEALRFKPIEADLHRIQALKDSAELIALLADLHLRTISGLFQPGVSPDAKNSEYEVFQLRQGGLGLPDRDYYFAESFAKQREAYEAHVARMFGLLGDDPARAKQGAAVVMSIETELAKASKTRLELRDPNANYNKLSLVELSELTPDIGWSAYLGSMGLGSVKELVVGQTNFMAVTGRMLRTRPITEWQDYLRWHVLNDAAPFLHSEVESASFEFYGKVLRGQPEQEPRWQRAARMIDSNVGEALGSLYVEKYFPEVARKRMTELVANVRAVFLDRLKTVDWMSEPTRKAALAKFERFTQKIGHPATFRDYSSVVVKRDDLYGNIQRASRAESLRQMAQVGRPVDKAEWHMTPQTVNAYFNPLQNEIVFPAAILQPPFFDLEADDAINYGAIGMVIGHEITHGYDDRGRQYDANGNLKDWWAESDAKEFEKRANKVVEQYSKYEALPGLKVNGQLTLGENLADLGGASIAFEALQRALAKDPTKRKNIDGFTPEQRFFLSGSQLWRVAWREAELRRRLTVDVHSPGQFRSIGAIVNMPEFFEAFDIKSGDPMWRPPEVRAKIW